MVNIKHVRGLPRSSFFWSMAAILGTSFARMYVCRAHAPASHAACHDDHENSNAWFSNFLCSHETYGAPLCGPSGRCGAPLKCRRSQTLHKHRKNLSQLQFLQATFRHCHQLNYRVIFSSTGSSGNRFGVPTSLLLDLTSKTTNTAWPRSLLASGR